VPFNRKAEAFEQSCGGIGDRLAVAGWIVGRHANECSQELSLLAAVVAQESTDALCRLTWAGAACCHDLYPLPLDRNATSLADAAHGARGIRTLVQRD